MSLEWYGDKLIAQVRAAEQAGLLVTDEAVAKGTGDRAPRKTGALAASYDVLLPPVATGDGFTSEVGSELDYALINEVGGVAENYPARPHLRPALDVEGSQLADNIRAALGIGD